MGKFANLMLAAMMASPFIIRYIRYRRLSAFVRMVPKLVEADFAEKKPEVRKDYFIRIPSFAVAAVIGKRGATLRKLMYDSQTECVIRSFSKEELDLASGEIKPDSEWTNRFQTEDWFSDDSTASNNKISYLKIQSSDEKKVQIIRLRVAEIIEEVKRPWKFSEFFVETFMVGYLVGRGGCNIKSLSDKFNVQIQISDPNPENPDKCTVTIRGRDLTSMKQVEIVMKETVLPRNYNKLPKKYDEDVFIESGIYEDVDQELVDLERAAEIMSRGFY